MDTTKENSEERKPKQMRLRHMPKDIREIILLEQAKQKVKCNCVFSLEQTIYKLIRKAARVD